MSLPGQISATWVCTVVCVHANSSQSGHSARGVRNDIMIASGGAAKVKPAQMQSARACVWCRRDLTINSLFYNINTREVEDFTGKGLDDLLEHRLIRTPLPPSETFRDGELDAS